jgi:enterochelin esterase-like enzyme
MKGWDRSFFSYTFVAPGKSNGPPPTVRHFHGSDAMPLPVIPENLRGKAYERTLSSRFLKEDRQISVYIPPGAKLRGLPVLFMADGQATVAFARAIEPVIVSGRAAPFAIVGIHTPPSQFSVGDTFDASRDRRSQEYLLGISPDAYAKHMKFFIEEVVPWASLEYGFSSAREDRAVFGFSSGAAFAAAAALQHPEIFGDALLFSIGFTQLPARPTGALPHFHLVAGELEPDFLASTRTVREVVAGWGADATLNVYMSGHDQLMWQVGLVQVIPRVFAAKHQ